MYKILKKEGSAKRAEFTTVHGVIQTPVFMNVATVAAIKGGVSTEDLEGIGTQVVLSNTYHLHLRPGDDLVYRMGGLHKFMSCNKPILTDSGGFQVFSLAKTRRIKEEGVYFHSHIDGHKLFMGPEESMRATGTIGKKGSCVVARDLESNVVWLHNFLFNDSSYSVSDDVKKYSDKIKSDTSSYLN